MAGYSLSKTFVVLLALRSLDVVPRCVLANFTFGSTERQFTCSGNDLWCEGDAASTTSGALTLTDNERGREGDYYLNGRGMALWSNSMDLLNNITFKTFFRFKIEALNGTRPGDGMAFVMVADRALGPGGGDLGVYNSSRAKCLVVEFDTYRNIDFDMSANHVGVNLGKPESEIARNASDVGIYLWNGDSIFSWIDYDFLSQKLEIRISRDNAKPEKSFLDYRVDLVDVFGHDRVYVGFSGSNGFCRCYNFYTVTDWRFESFPVFPLVKATNKDLPAPNPLPVQSGGGSKVALIGGVTGGIITLVSIFGFLFCCVWKRKRNTGNGVSPVENELVGVADSLRFNYNELSLATSQFHDSCKLGQGGFGSVYRGVMPGTGQLVAIKKVSTDSRQGRREFVAEVSIIRQLRHRYVVKLLGWCSDEGKFLLVYEFMPNGSLDKFLFHATRESVLRWTVRFDIMRGAAEALQYLHEGWRQQIIHRDFKSSNIMLDENFNAMLGDFGLARMVDRRDDPATTGLAGTYGYIAPETPFTGKFTEKTDVYAFGAVALEVATGRRAYDPRLAVDEILLVDWVWRKLEEGNLLSVVDHNLDDMYDVKQIEVVLLLGLLCSHPNSDDRPNMRQVVNVLEGTVALPPVPISKPAPKYERYGREYRVEALMSSGSSGTSTGSSGKVDTPVVWSSQPTLRSTSREFSSSLNSRESTSSGHEIS